MAEFRTSARAVDMLGRQQIAGIPSAISELYKNAHDAYASNAEVDFIRYKSAFVIRDDGDGMSRADFETKWLTLGTSSKYANFGNAKGMQKRPSRAILGEKGIGRLAIAAIGPQVLVVTKTQDAPRVTSLIHWGVFELAHADLSQLLVPVEEIPEGTEPDVMRMGKAILSNLESLLTPDDRGLYEKIASDIEQWAHIDLGEIAQISDVNLGTFGQGTAFVILPASPDLEADLEPAGPKEAAPLLRTLIGFANTMTPGHSSPELRTVFRDHRAPDSVQDLIQEQEFFTVEEFLKADHHFQGEFDEYGQFSGTVSIFGGDPISFPLAWNSARGARTKCGPLKLNLAYIQGRAKQSRLDANEYFLMAEKLDRYGGLYIYRDGIRVLPYGDSRVDWLDVELRRTKSAADSFFSYRRMFGAVEISRLDNFELREKAGREGFATNEAYRQFRAMLQNFLVQVAAEFFRDGGAQAEVYQEGRLANERMENARRARSKHVRTRRAEYNLAMEQFFSFVDGNIVEARTENIEKELRVAIDAALREDDAGSAADRLVSAEREARRQLRNVVADLEVKRPRGIALSAEMTRRSAEYEAARSEVMSRIVEPVERRIELEASRADSENQTALHRRLRFDASVAEVTREARVSLGSGRRELADLLDETRKRATKFSLETHRSVERVVVDALKSAATTDVSAMSDEEFSAARSLLENTVRSFATEATSDLGELAAQLRSLTFRSGGRSVDGASLIDQVEQLETQVEILSDRSAQDFELVQIGMAVNIVTHEFENSIKAVRDNLRRLRTWAQQNVGLRPLYGDLRASFDHLDGYLKLFTPLHRRLYREPTTIRGLDVQRYLSDVFERRLKQEGVLLDVSAEFEGMRLRMYPSTLYPVIVNLVDNAIFWLSGFNGPRVIHLDKLPGMVTVTDSGQGVRAGDEESIFEQGFSRKPAGSGYGLYVAREVLRRDGSDIRVAAPAADRGARFEILLAPESEESSAN